ncbi:Helix-turn-helix protein [Candidatus Methanoperedens nitroreducens]|uniref:Helix-turn-helix protein n=1 Tax=Candidatus Methanoperedens nitratireducens TaxID=1392998 RepID=A0A062V3U9_9EURY|nr:helix-turn-helix transcriptional regulator [Candidatus Methanoperedens nitroreducens]KCZ71298.1 Helix-turn-helix protein [Candidatus Methanoperedens nitroreducens]MDJ1423765.1 helix-turn-helix transcriptional regulator [Candidatus Methanoperedens sp.]
MEFGQKLRKLREERGISQQELAKKLGYKSNSYIFDIENGDFIPSEDKLKKLAKALRIPFSRMKDMMLESKLEDMGIKDPRFIGMFKDYSRLGEEDKEAIAKVYLEIREAKLGAGA